jgi:hypothetical protein
VIAAAKGTSAKLCDCEAEVLRIKKKIKRRDASGAAVQCSRAGDLSLIQSPPKPTSIFNHGWLPPVTTREMRKFS